MDIIIDILHMILKQNAVILPHGISYLEKTFALNICAAVLTIDSIFISIKADGISKVLKIYHVRIFRIS